MKPYRRHLLLCTGPRCTTGESRTLWDRLGAALAAAELDNDPVGRVKRTQCSCFAVCKGGPILCVQPDGIWYAGVTPEVFARIVQEHLQEGRPVESHIFHRGPSVTVAKATS